MKTARTCTVVQNYYDVDPRVRRKAGAIVAVGYPVDVIALREPRNAPRPKVGLITFYDIPLQKKRGGRIRYFYEYLAFWVSAFTLLTALSIKHKYAVVDVNNLPDFLVFAALVPKMLGARVVLDMHEVTPEFYMSKFGVARNSVLVRLLKCMERWSVRFADHVLASNDLIADTLVSRGVPPSKLTVLMNSADESMFRAADAPKLAEQDGASNAVPLTLMYHGTLTSAYGLDIAIEALAKVRCAMPDLSVRFNILGSGPHRDTLAQKSKCASLDGTVEFLGTVPLDRVPQYLAACDVGLLPTRSDVFLDLSFSNKLAEYVVMGKPVIAARLPGYRRYFREQSIAFFEPGNPDSLAEQIVNVALGRERWPALVSNALSDYEAISWPVMEQRYRALMHRLLRESVQGSNS